MSQNYDFCGYATRNDILCADGRIIKKNAFKECDGNVVPLVWQHDHSTPGTVLGHAVLENREDGIYAYGSLNSTEAGKNAKELIKHGDIKSLSIYANKLIQKGGDVLHGVIREVSLCLAGANPGAVIEDISFAHFDDEDAEFEAFIAINDNSLEHYEEEQKEDTLAHADDKKEDNKEMADENKKTENVDNEEETVQDIIDTMNEKQKNVLYFLISEAYSKNPDNPENADEDKEDDKEMMKHAYNANPIEADILIHDAFNEVLKDAKRCGSFRDAYNRSMDDGGALAHAIDTTGMELPTLTNQEFGTRVGYGINGIDMLLPEARAVTPEPEFISRDQDWVTDVWNSVHRFPFARIKSWFANITEDEARAKGYIKGKMKKEEYFSVMKRVTQPQTVYKKQKLDRDDIIDITDFDSVKFVRNEMRVMWNEEVARAFLIGDGRIDGDDDRISPECIRPIYNDKPLFTIQKEVVPAATPEATAKNFMRAAIRARKDYKGSGNPALYTTDDVLSSMLLIEDGLGHYIYKNISELETALRVSKIVVVPVMEGLTLENGNEVMGIIVNLRDYAVGMDPKGSMTLFDDFDIDFNQYKYLIEARCSGSLIKPFSAITLSVPVTQSGNDDGDDDNP